MLRWSGKHGKVFIDGYEVGDLQEWVLETTATIVEVTALDDDWAQRIRTHSDARVTANKFARTGGFSLLDTMVNLWPNAVTVQLFASPANGGHCQWEAPMHFESVRYTNPQGAISEDVTFTLAGRPTIVDM